jgi:hypothetical protein
MPNKKNNKTNTRNKSKNKFVLFIRSNRNLAIAAILIMVVVFGFVGVRVAQRSNAAIVPWYCPYNTYIQTSPPYHYQPCVVEIQKMLNSVGWQNGYSGYRSLTADGIFGPSTAGQVEQFAKQLRSQYYMPPSIYYGSVTSYPQGNGQWSTWRVLCGYYLVYNGRDGVWTQAGCGRIPTMPFN